jgi:hypothetical protein
MGITLHSTPPAVAFANNPMQFDFSTAEHAESFVGLHFKTKVYNETTQVYDEASIEKRITPDADHHAIFDVSKILRWNPDKAFTYPGNTSDLVTKRNDLRKKYYLTYSQKYGTPLVEYNIDDTGYFYVLSGGLSRILQSKYNQDSSSWWADKLAETSKSFLSRSPLIKNTDIAAAERLYFICPENKAELYLHVKVYYVDEPDGIETIRKKITNAAIYDIYEIDCSYLSLGLGFTAEDSGNGNVTKWEVWLEDGSAAYSEVRSFILDDVYSSKIRHFIFNNCFGVPEGIRFTGLLTEKAGFAGSIATFIRDVDDIPSDGEQNFVDAFEQRSFSVNSGWITREEVNQLREFLTSRRRYWLVNSMALPVVFNDVNIITSEDNQHLFSAEMEFSLGFEDDSPADDLTPATIVSSDYGIGDELTTLDPARFANESYQTFTADGETIDFVAAGASTAKTVELTDVLPGDILVLIYTLTLTSGELPKFAIYDDDHSADPLVEASLVAGTNYLLIRAPYVDDLYAYVDCYGRVKNTAASQFTLANCSLKKVNTEFLKQIFHENNN